MIRPLRVRHRSMILTLAVITPVLFVAGLAVRRPVPATPDPEVETGFEAFEMIGESAVSGELPLRAIWLRAPRAGVTGAVTIELSGPVKQPDLLAYWDDPSDDAESLSGDAYLLGPLGGHRRVTWGIPAPSASGRLLLYSTARKQVLGSAAPPPSWGAVP